MEDLPRIRCPTLIVAAGKEPIGFANAYDAMHERIEGSKLLKYEDIAIHNICDQYADRCAGDLLRFLEKQAA
jgi:pimeloyl-ACP methyl ester carboxylesterase